MFWLMALKMILIEFLETIETTVSTETQRRLISVLLIVEKLKSEGKSKDCTRELT